MINLENQKQARKKLLAQALECRDIDLINTNLPFEFIFQDRKYTILTDKEAYSQARDTILKCYDGIEEFHNGFLIFGGMNINVNN